jgi:hypothetical protein
MIEFRRALNKPERRRMVELEAGSLSAHRLGGQKLRILPL